MFKNSLFFLGIFLCSCNGLSDCEKNLIESLEISSRGYASIQDENIWLTDSEVKQLYALSSFSETSKARLVFKAFQDCIPYESLKLNSKYLYLPKNQVLSKSEFSDLVKKQFPQYLNVDEKTLIESMTSKYPIIKNYIVYSN